MSHLSDSCESANQEIYYWRTTVNSKQGLSAGKGLPILFMTERLHKIVLWRILERSGKVDMKNPNQDVQAILHAIVSDLEKTSAGLTYALRELNKSIPMSAASVQAAIALATLTNKEVYDELRKQIDALESTSE